jgi:hypothetical protein
MHQRPGVVAPALVGGTFVLATFIGAVVGAVVGSAGVVGTGTAAPARPDPAQVAIQNGRVDIRRGTDPAREIAAVMPQGAAPPVWVLWRAPLVAGDRDLCSTWFSDRDGYARLMQLETRPPDGAQKRPVAAPAPDAVSLESGTGLVVLVRLDQGRIERLRTITDNCPIDAAGLTVARLDSIAPADSLRFLDRLRGGEPALVLPASAGAVAREALTAIALHRDAMADALLERQATTDLDAARRRSAVSLIGTYRDTLAILATVAGADRDAGVRGEAAYWLGARGGPGRLESVTRFLSTEADASAKARAVAGIGRWPADQAAPALIQLARTTDDAAVRKAAVSALGRNRDPRALAYLEELIRR